MAKFICPACKAELDTIECRVNHFLLYHEDLQGYRCRGTSSFDDPGAYHCTECGSYIPYEEEAV